MTGTDWRQALARHPVHDLPPAGASYVLGRWHPDRASLKGYLFEAQVAAKALRARHSPRKFLMVGRPRSGTTLLGRLLNQVEGVRCDGETLHNAVLCPHGMLNRRAGLRPMQVYGSKLLSYQIFEVQKIADPPGFFETLLADGYTLIHLRRETFDQTLSLAVAQAGHAYHIRDGAAAPAGTVTLDPEVFARQLRHFAAMLDYEDLLFSQLPHLRVQYEDDLKDPGAHQPTIDRICAALGVAPTPVSADLARVSDRRDITNLDALRAVAEPILSQDRRRT